MATRSELPLSTLEPRLRHLLPADLYASVWMDQRPVNLELVFEHLRTLYRILHNYVPRQLAEMPPGVGHIRHSWEEGTLMFTDLAGFTTLMEASATRGQAGAVSLLNTLNEYFASMIEIVSKSGGELLEFTGDAILVQFPANQRGDETAQAVRAGLRMQRAMSRFAAIETDYGPLPLEMRIGIHVGRFLTADIGTPRRMEHVLLGSSVIEAKRAEGAGVVGRINLTGAAYDQVSDLFDFEEGSPGYYLVVDNLSEDELGTFEIAIGRRRSAGAVLFDRSEEGLLVAITDMVDRIEPLAAFIPAPVLNLVVESASQREIPPDFPRPTAIFVSVQGLPEAVDHVWPDAVSLIVNAFSRVFARINGAVEARGGVLKKVTYHKGGSDMLILFGVPVAHTDDPLRAAAAALAIRDIVLDTAPPEIAGHTIVTECHIGMAQGPVFAAEFGEPRGRRDFNALGDTINTAARLMGRAVGSRILMTEVLQVQICEMFACQSLGVMPLKGKSARTKVFALERAYNPE